MRNSSKIRASDALLKMLQRYELNSLLDYKNALKEIVQEIALLGLWRAKFFEKAAFYGGTALRILYHLDRFSEDLDFSLLAPNPKFNLANYEKAIQEELRSLGFIATVEKKKKTQESTIDSAFIKINTIQHLLLVGLPKGIGHNIHPNEMIKIRFEVDVDPPVFDLKTENAYLLLPYPFSIKTFRLEDLFAGKVHATLCREWKGRVKGRDWYDLIWFIVKEIPLNIRYLEARMRQSGFWTTKAKLQLPDVLAFFENKIQALDIVSAKQDIINFIKDSSVIDVWSKDFFRHLIKQINISENEK